MADSRRRWRELDPRAAGNFRGEHLNSRREERVLNGASSGPVAFRIKWARYAFHAGENSRAKIYLGPARSSRRTLEVYLLGYRGTIQRFEN